MSDTSKLKKLSRDAGIKPHRDLTKMDKIRAYYLEGRKLPKSLQETVEKLEKANGLLCSGYSREQAVKFISENAGVTRSQAYKIVRESTELFGDVTKSSKEGLRHIITEGMMQIYNHARQQKNLEVAERVLTSVARINNLYTNDDNGGKLNVGTFNIIFTTDESALIESDEQPTIDISHVEVK
jgi:hypothetical protein